MRKWRNTVQTEWEWNKTKSQNETKNEGKESTTKHMKIEETLIQTNSSTQLIGISEFQVQTTAKRKKENNNFN